jgi:protein phosphatase 2C family protein 2/3
MCYLANVGDSRAIMSVDGGEKILLLSRDHKPEAPDETKRIEENGGRIYQNSNYIPDITPDGKSTMHLIVGPHRVFPGRLSVSRTIGDIEAKHPKYGGNPRVVIPTADIKAFKIRNNYDFIMLACDGVFEKLSNHEVVRSVWQASEKPSIHERCGAAVDRVLQFSAYKRTFDNITSVMIAFENFENIAGTSASQSKVTMEQTPAQAGIT